MSQAPGKVDAMCRRGHHECRDAALIDLNRKKAAYERFGVPSYWIVNPDPAQPELTVLELRDGRYALAAKASGPFTAGRPFTVSIAPADLDPRNCAN